ncbi:MAG: hypothetical protein FWC43_09685 [Planctomycetaceae bacterium]|nr:hypothetical protein [Planctomycetaceae bacterium]
MQRALFAQEYRQLEDELFLAYQNMARLERSNAILQAQLGQENQESREEPFVRPDRRRTNPNVAPISTEGLEPSERMPGILQNPQSRSLVKPLPQPVEQAQYLEPEFAVRPRRPSGNTTADLPTWRPNR